MKEYVSLLLVLLFSLAGISCSLAETAEEALSARKNIEMAEASVTDGSQTLDFQYPAGCALELQKSTEALVILNDDAYVAVVLMESGTDIEAWLRENKYPEAELVQLAENMHLLAYRNFTPIGLSFAPPLDIVEVGLMLPDGMSVIVQSTCTGGTEIYEVLTAVLASITDGQPLEAWLNDAWLPNASSTAADAHRH